MTKRLFFCLAIVCFLQLNLSGNNWIENVKLYCTGWKATHCTLYTCENIKETNDYYFESSSTKLYNMFHDSADAAEKLSQRKIYLEADTAIGHNVYYLAEVYFTNNKMISIGFDVDGNYFFNGHWHIKHDALFYALFCFLSNEIVSPTALDQAKKNMKSYFWEN